jgi:hypothetical protein
MHIAKYALQKDWRKVAINCMALAALDASQYMADHWDKNLPKCIFRAFT